MLTKEDQFAIITERLRARALRTLAAPDAYAGVAQLVEQLICNQQVGGSSPSTSSIAI